MDASPFKFRLKVTPKRKRSEPLEPLNTGCHIFDALIARLGDEAATYADDGTSAHAFHVVDAPSSSTTVPPSSASTLSLKDSTTIGKILAAAATEMRCCVCYDVMDKAVVLPCSHGYCEGCITKSLSLKGNCPLCKEATHHRSLIHPEPLRKAITALAAVAAACGISDLTDMQEVNERLLKTVVPTQQGGNQRAQPEQASPCEDISLGQGSYIAITQQQQAEGTHVNNSLSTVFANKATIAKRLFMGRLQVEDGPVPEIPLFALPPNLQSAVSLKLRQGPPAHVKRALTPLLTQVTGRATAGLGGSPQPRDQRFLNLMTDTMPVGSLVTQSLSPSAPAPSRSRPPAEDPALVLGAADTFSSEPQAIHVLSAGLHTNEIQKDMLRQSLPSMAKVDWLATQSNQAPPADAHCALCGLCVADRTLVRKYLRMLLACDPTSDRSAILGLDEGQLTSLFGPLVAIPFVIPTRMDTERVPATAFAHELCLLWSPCVGFSEGDDGEVAAACASSALELGWSTPCAFCHRLGATVTSGSGPSANAIAGAFHAPCALLTGDGVCTI